MVYLILFFSVIIGSLSVLFIKPKKILTQILLAFSGAYLLSITILHLLPHVYENHSHNIGLYILFGILMQSILENFSKGVEHGHVHIHSNLEKVPWLLVISLAIHAFFEGIPLSHETNQTLLWAIVIHKIPIAIVLTSFLLQSKLSKIAIIGIVGLFATMSPLGSFASDNIAFFEIYLTEITAVIIGIFLHISTIILFETSENHNFNLKKLIAIILGFAIAWLNLH